MNEIMHVSRGLCVLCPQHCAVTKVVQPSDAKHITDLLKDLLAKYIDVDKFKDTKNTLKVCPLCLGRLQQAYKYSKYKEFNCNSSSCSLCLKHEELIGVSDWTQLNKLLDNLCMEHVKKCCLCVSCIQYLDTLGSIKDNFLYKYPHLKISPRKMALFKSKTTSWSLQQQGFTLEQCEYDDKLHTQIVKVLLRKVKQKTKPTNFFKIKLSSKVNKKRAKPKPSRPSVDKELFVKINTEEVQPLITKASKKMVIDEPEAEVKKKKVSFNDTMEIIGEPKESDSDSDVEDKGYVAEILHNNDDIFNKLKTSVVEPVFSNGVDEEVADLMANVNGVDDVVHEEEAKPVVEPMIEEQSENVKDESNNCMLD